MIISTIVPRHYQAHWAYVKALVKTLQDGDYEFASDVGPSVPDNRSFAFERARHLNQHLLFIDSDTLFTPQDVRKVKEHLCNGEDAVTGVYVLGEPYDYALFNRIEGDYEFTEPTSGYVDAAGTGFLGINKKVIQEMDQGAFINGAFENGVFNNIWEGDIKHGTDVSFCHRMREQGFKLLCDDTISLGHIRPFAVYPDKSHEEVS